MKNRNLYRILIICLVTVVIGTMLSVTAFAEEGLISPAPSEQAAAEQNDGIGTKALSAAIVVGLAATAGAIAMGLTISKSVESMARQPEASGKINSAMMLGLVFIETAIIYALIVAILVIFVL